MYLYLCFACEPVRASWVMHAHRLRKLRRLGAGQRGAGRRTLASSYGDASDPRHVVAAASTNPERALGLANANGG